MADLRTQLRSYVEATIERVDVVDVVAARAVGITPAPVRTRWRRPVVVALAAALAASILIGGIALLDRWFREDAPAVTTTTVTTTTTLPPTTSLAPTTTEPGTTTSPSSTTTIAPAMPEILAMTWTRATDQEALLRGWMAAATIGGPGFVAVGGSTAGAIAPGIGGPAQVSGADACAWISSDGVNWERIDSGSFRGVTEGDGTDGDQHMTDVTAGPTGLVAVGSDEQVGAVVWISPDGRTWSRVPDDPALLAGDMYAVVVGGPGFVAVGEAEQRSAAWASTDGITWRRVFLGEEYEVMQDVVAWQGRLYAVGYQGWYDFESRSYPVPFRPVVWTSADGLIWERVGDAPAPGEPGLYLSTAWPDTQSDLRMVVADDGGLIALGYTITGGRPLPVAWRSADGDSWTAIPASFLDYEERGHLPTKAVFAEGRLLFAHGAGEVWGSADGGIFWNQVAEFEMGRGASLGGEFIGSGAAAVYQWVNDLLAFPGGVIGVGQDGAWSGTEDIGGGTCSWDPGDGSGGQCRTDAAVWIGTWDQ